MNKKTLIALGAGFAVSLASSSIVFAESNQTTSMQTNPVSQAEKATQIKHDGKCKCGAEKCDAKHTCDTKHKADHNNINKHDMNTHKTLEEN